MAIPKPLNKIYEGDLYLWPGTEKDLGPFNYWQGGTIRVFTSGLPLHYAGVYDAPEYRRLRPRVGRFPFLLGTARTGHSLESATSGFGQFFVVIRKSGWALGTFPIHVIVEYG